MRLALGLCLVLASLALGAVLPACHEEFVAPDKPDLMKPRRSFDFDLSGVFIDDEDLSVTKPGDLAHPDLSKVDATL